MESIVEDVEEKGQTEGSPANSKCCEDSRGCEVMGISISVNHNDFLSRFGHYLHKVHHCKTKRINTNIAFRK